MLNTIPLLNNLRFNKYTCFRIPQASTTNVPRKQSAKFTSQNPGIDKGDSQYEEIQNPDGKVMVLIVLLKRQVTSF